MAPFRIFFPLGIVCGIWGASVWVLFATHVTDTYPGTTHPDVMMGGFLFSFAAGFLMTAVPRFTASFAAAAWEIAAVAVSVLATVACDVAALWNPDWRAKSLLASCVAIALVMAFCARRFLARKASPPPFFAFVGMGLVMGFAGSLVLFLNEAGFLSDGAIATGRSLYYHGMMLSLVLGVGSRLVPALLGLVASPLEGPVERSALAFAGLFAASFPIELAVSQEGGRALRALIATLIAIGRWRIHRPPPQHGVLQTWIRLSGLSLVAGLWLYALAPGYAVHGVHLAFIGGLSLLTMLVATRVTLSHGGFGTSLERTSRALWWSGVGFLVAAVTRVLAFAVPRAYAHHLAYAAVVWILAILVWAAAFLGKLTRPRPGAGT